MCIREMECKVAPFIYLKLSLYLVFSNRMNSPFQPEETSMMYEQHKGKERIGYEHLTSCLNMKSDHVFMTRLPKVLG